MGVIAEDIRVCDLISRRSHPALDGERLARLRQLRVSLHPIARTIEHQPRPPIHRLKARIPMHRAVEIPPGAVLCILLQAILQHRRGLLRLSQREERQNQAENGNILHGCTSSVGNHSLQP